MATRRSVWGTGRFRGWTSRRPSIVMQEVMIETRHAPEDQIVEIFPQRVGRRRTAGNEIIDADDFVDRIDLVEQERQLRVVGDMRPNAVCVAIDLSKISPTSRWLRFAGRPPLIAGADRDRTWQLARSSRSTCTFSALQTPPSISPMSQGPQCLMSVSGERSNSAILADPECARQCRAATCGSRSSPRAKSWRDGPS